MIERRFLSDFDDSDGEVLDGPGAPQQMARLLQLEGKMAEAVAALGRLQRRRTTADSAPHASMAPEPRLSKDGQQQDEMRQLFRSHTIPSTVCAASAAEDEHCGGGPVSRQAADVDRPSKRDQLLVSCSSRDDVTACVATVADDECSLLTQTHGSACAATAAGSPPGIAAANDGGSVTGAVARLTQRAAEESAAAVAKARAEQRRLQALEKVWAAGTGKGMSCRHSIRCGLRHRERDGLEVLEKVWAAGTRKGMGCRQWRRCGLETVPTGAEYDTPKTLYT